jgi:hypothetical protein
MVAPKRLKWSSISGRIDEEYGKKVVESALKHFPLASKELRTFAQHELSKSVQIPGFHRFGTAPYKRAYKSLLDQFDKKSIVAFVVTALWAEAHTELINDLMSQISDKGAKLQFSSDWKACQEGYYTWDEVEDLTTIFDSLMKDRTSDESNEALIAGIWIVTSSLIHSNGSGSNGHRPHVEHATETTVPPEEILITIVPDTVVKTIPPTEEPADISHTGEPEEEDTENIDPNELELILNKELPLYVESKKRMEEILSGAKSYLLQESLAKPELHLDLAFLDPGKESIESKTVLVQECIRKIGLYEVEKKDLIKKLEKALSEITNLRSELQEWHLDMPVGRDFGLQQDYRDLSNQQIKTLYSEAQTDISSLKSQQTQFRQSRIAIIKNLAASLIEADDHLDTKIEDFKSLEDFIINPLTDWDIPKLKRAEDQLVLRMQDMKRRTSEATAKLVLDFESAWSQESLDKLLERLTSEKKDIENYLLVLAINAARPEILKDMVFAKDVTRSILNGFEQFSKSINPYTLLNYSAPVLFLGWQTDNLSAKMEICLLLLTAKYAGQFQLPPEILWETPEWPDKNMKAWSRIWEQAVTDEPLRIVQSSEADHAKILNDARLHAEQMLAKDHGSFVRLISVKSRRHAAMLRTHVLPKIVEYFESALKFEESLNVDMSVYEKQRLIKQLESFSTALLNEYNEDAILESYEHGVALEKINDIDPFHRRTSLKLISEMAQSVIDYAHALQTFWVEHLKEDDGIRYSDLESELLRNNNLSEFAIHSLDILANSSSSQMPFERNKIEECLKRAIVSEILGQSFYPLRFTHLIGYLVNENLEWNLMLLNLFEDIKSQLEKEAAAAYLLEKQAPNHVLMLTQYLPLEMQKAAQELRIQKEHEVTKLEAKLLRFGGELDELLNNKDLGRWPYLICTLNKSLAEAKSAFEFEQISSQNLAKQLRTEINALDNSLFDVKDTIPADAFQILKRCLDLSRNATEKNEYAGSVQEFLKEIHYRLEHQSWPVEDLRDLEDQLKNLSASDKTPHLNKINADDLLSILDAGEISKIGLTIEDIAMSSVATRADILRNWLQIKRGDGFLLEKQQAGLRLSIQSLFRYFAQMVAMKKTLDPQGRPIANDYPFIYSYWDLQYPKTSVLDTNCVFVAMPGDPPAPDDVAQFQNKLEQDEWLDYYFVFLFMPAGNIKLRQRLQDAYKNKPLVIIDESALISMILGEQDGKIPLGVLRPLMLNSLKTQSIDVFKVSNLVDAYSSIFLGRDAQIEQIVSSASNYAIYGGRRIGKSSVMNAVEKRLIKRGVRVISYDFQGELDVSDSGTSKNIARKLGIEKYLKEHGDFKSALDSYLENNPDVQIALMLDEIDKYIVENPIRHILIETCRAMSDRHPGQFRVIIAGFMKLYDCLQGKSPYTPTSDPWQRMFTGKLLNNLSPVSAEGIVKEGFLQILGWRFENRSIPQKIVELTGGHPAFVQALCQRVQEKVGPRNDRIVRLDDIQDVFNDKHPLESFIAFVRNTLKMNLDPIGRYLIVWLASESKDALGFTWKEILEYASLSEVPIPEGKLEKSVRRLVVTNVIREIAPQAYEFSVPDYPKILNQLNDQSQLKTLFDEMVEYLQKNGDAND